MNASLKAGILAEALPYLREFHGKTLVIRFGGNAMADPALKAGFARDVALLRLVGMKPIVVHGGGWGIDLLMRKMGVEPQRYRGYRITDERTLTVVEMALSELNQELTSLINQEGATFACGVPTVWTMVLRHLAVGRWKKPLSWNSSTACSAPSQKHG